MVRTELIERVISMANRIPKAQLQQMFDNISANTPWDIHGEMLWGYFFTDSDEARLKSASKLLEQQGYQYVEIFLPAEDEADSEYFILHVEKIEKHTVDSLYQRNAELAAFAKDNGLETYDGMDVGPVKSDIDDE